MTEHNTPQQESIPVTVVQTRRISAKEIAYCYALLEGLKPKDAALSVGFKHTIATQASRWIREDRERSSKPWMFDYFAKLLKAKLRHFDVTVDNVLRELTIIGFSDISAFIEIPSQEELKQDALDAKALGFEARQSAQADEWKKLRLGSTIRLKTREQINPALWPAVAEISETKDGIKIKLHNKIAALEKLAKYLAMYQNASADPDDIGQSVREINLIVEGSRSPLMKLIQGGDDQAQKTA